MEKTLFPGFRFYPVEEELFTFYLYNKLQDKRQDMNSVIPVVNVFDMEPWDLPRYAGERCQGDSEQWFFFAPMQEREFRGGRPNRTTASGYWKATGTPTKVYSSDNRAIGMKKTMVFYKGKAPTGRKTKWKMNEYKAMEILDPSAATHSLSPMTENITSWHKFSVCRVYVTSGSDRAFDRRPLEVISREANIPAGNPIAGSSSETLYSGGHRRLEENNIQIVDDLQQSQCGWEQFY